MVSFTIYRMEKQINLVDKYCKRLSLGCDVKKSKTRVFEKGGKLKTRERRRMKIQNAVEVDKNYLLRNKPGKYRKLEQRRHASWSQRMPSNKFYAGIRILLDSIYELVCDSATAYIMRDGKKLRSAW